MNDKSAYQGILLFGGKAMTVEINVHSSMPIGQALKSLEDMSETKFTMIPHGDVSCAGFARFEDRKFFLMYFPPKRRQFLWKNKWTGEQKAFVVWWPHVYLGVFFRGGAIEDGYAMLSKKKLTSPTDKLGRMPFPNLSKKYGHVCEGKKGMWNVMDKPEETVASYADYFLKSEWISDINDHWPYVPKALQVPGYNFNAPISGDMVIEDVNQRILSIWQSISETDPKSVEAIDWKENFTIQELIWQEWTGKPSIDGSPISVEQIQQILHPAALAPGQQLVAAHVNVQ